MFSGRLAAFAATAVVASGCLAGCGSSSPAADAAQPGKAGLTPGQGTISIQSKTTEFDASKQSAAIHGVVDGLALTATGNGTDTPEAPNGRGWCGRLGTLGSSVSGMLGGVPFTVTLTSCDISHDPEALGTYTGDWGGRRVNLTITAFFGIGSDVITVHGTVGSQHVTAKPEVPDATQGTNQITGTITVS